jgi:predicted LPLAT superfamily acyltransferase
VSDDLSHLFTVYTALQNGEVVSIPCDRNLGSPKCVTCHFLNGEADFPTGPFSLAETLGVEVLSIFVTKERGKKYTVHVTPLSADVPPGQASNKEERVAAYVRSFASEVERIVRRYPEQWFNYYEFWKE